MRKLTLILIAAAAVFGAFFTMQSCSKSNDVTQKLHYDIPLHTGAFEVVIPPTDDTSSSHILNSGTTYINIDSFVKANTKNVLGVNNITSVKITAVKLTLLDGTTTNNFANFQSCSASFYSNANTNPYSVSIPNNPDATVYTLDLPIDPNAELKSYMTGNAFTYSVGGKLRRPVTQPVKCKIEFGFNIVVNG
jgi:hypothetical protein